MAATHALGGLNCELTFERTCKIISEGKNEMTCMKILMLFCSHSALSISAQILFQKNILSQQYNDTNELVVIGCDPLIKIWNGKNH